MTSSGEQSSQVLSVTRAPAGVLTWLQLMRFPTVFTALSNILCGFLITHRLKVQELPLHGDLWLLLGATTGLYLGGMVLNDVFDATLDAVERPERPIPSGRVTRKSAGIFGAILMLAGVLAAAAVGWPALLVAGLIVPAVLLYNGVLKSTKVAPLGMGTCRFLNLMLGASAVPSVESLFQQVPLTAAAALGLYVIGVTLFARNEAGRSSSAVLVAALVIVICGIALDAWLIGESGATPAAISGSRMALLLLGLNLLMRGAAVVPDPKPQRIQRTVGLMLLCIIFLDAILVFAMTADAKLAAIVVMLVVPASQIRRLIPMS